jgi:hypothetical protein
MLAPIGFKCFRIFRTDHNHLRLPFFKFQIVLAQLRHVPLAEWSGKAAIEYEQYVGLPFEIG